ncbi:hypothetical protein [Natrialba hulunbeirensis]|nr:hypothetical protein [Natrialba hulunbeirensis]
MGEEEREMGREVSGREERVRVVREELRAGEYGEGREKSEWRR